VHQAAAGHDTLVTVVVAVLAGGVILLPALTLLFRLTIAGRFRAELALPESEPARRSSVNVRLSARLALACLIAGIGLLNIADAAWAHAIGVACLIAFVALAFGAIAIPALDDQPAPDSHGARRTIVSHPQKHSPISSKERIN
jgi:cytochrome d ubiquinol oxidase subunit II